MSLHEIQRVLEEADPVARLACWLELSEPEQRAAVRLAEERRREESRIIREVDEWTE